MAFAVTYGIKKGKELIIENGKKMNYTDYIKEICNDFFVEETFLEDNEEVIYNIMKFESVSKVFNILNDSEQKIKKDCVDTKGNDKKNELIRQIHDYYIFLSIIAEVFMLKAEGNDTVITLV